MRPQLRCVNIASAGSDTSLVGLIAGALSGSFLQTIALTTVTASGSLTEPTTAEAAVIELLLGATVGAIAMAVVGFLKAEVSGKG